MIVDLLNSLQERQIILIKWTDAEIPVGTTWYSRKEILEDNDFRDIETVGFFLNVDKGYITIFNSWAPDSDIMAGVVRVPIVALTDVKIL